MPDDAHPASAPPVNSLQREAAMMNLEALIAEREVIAIDPLPIPQAEMLARYEALYTGAVSDVLREHCLMDQALPSHLIPLRPERTVAGVAFTVKSAPSTRVSGELTFRTAMLDQIEDGSFIVWDTSGDTEATAWGGVMTATMAGKGVRAAVIDGGLRDTAQVLQKDFPVFYQAPHPQRQPRPVHDLALSDPDPPRHDLDPARRHRAGRHRRRHRRAAPARDGGARAGGASARQRA